MTSAELFTKALAVLAFVTAFYTLAARERKTPYITNSLYATLYLFLLAILLSFGSLYVPPIHPRSIKFLSLSASVVFGLAVLVVAYKLWQLQNRHVHFRDDNLVGNVKIVRSLRSAWRSLRRKPTYEHSPMPFSAELRSSIAEHSLLKANSIAVKEAIERERFSSIYWRATSLTVADNWLVDLAFRFLECGCPVQYTTCIRHPFEFAIRLKQFMESAEIGKTAKTSWQEAAQKLVLVDAYTPHFGFTDSVHTEATKKLREMSVKRIITSAPTYAGVHTASAKAFNAIKRGNDQQPRRPTLVIYEGTYALSDLESIEQYRIFVRHVIPSERLWGGMLTLFLETQIPSEAEALVKSYADIYLPASSEGHAS